MPRREARPEKRTLLSWPRCREDCFPKRPQREITAAAVLVAVIAIDTGPLAGLRDRALLSVMLYSFARVSAVLGDAAAGGSGFTRRAGSGTTFRSTIARRRRSTPTSSRPGSKSRTRRSSKALDPAGRRLTGRVSTGGWSLAMSPSGAPRPPGSRP